VVAAVVAEIIVASSAKAAGAEKWKKAEPSLLPSSSMPEKFESPIGWDRS
jgi:hypothetical protein